MKSCVSCSVAIATFVLGSGCLPGLPEEIEQDSDGHGGSDGAAEACPALDPLVSQGPADHQVGNCHVFAGFGPNGSGLNDLRTLRASTENLLYAGDPGDRQQLSGVVLANPGAAGSLASWQGTEFEETYVMQNGAAVYRVQAWSLAERDGRALHTKTIYTVIADGRIVRDDYVLVEGADAEDSFLTAYLALRADALTHVEWSGEDDDDYEVEVGGAYEVGSGLHTGEGTNVAYSTCAYNEGNGAVIGYAMHDASREGEHHFVGPRATVSQHQTGEAAAGTVLLQADWARGDVPEDTQYFGEMLFHVTTDVDGDPCAQIAAYAAAYYDPGQLQWGAGSLDIGEVSGAEGSSGTHFSYGGGFYFAAIDASDPPATLELALSDDAQTQPTMLLHIAGMSVGDLERIDVAGVALAPTDYVTQTADTEGEGGVWALDAGLWVLIGVPVLAGDPISIKLKG